MSIAPKFTGYRRLRRDVVGIVCLKDAGSILDSDVMNFSRAKARAKCIDAIEERLSGNNPGKAKVDQLLLDAFVQGKEELDADPAPEVPAEADDEVRVEITVAPSWVGKA